MSTITRRIIPAIAVAGTMMLVATGCVAGENATASDASKDDAAAAGEWSSDTPVSYTHLTLPTKA